MPTRNEQTTERILNHHANRVGNDHRVTITDADGTTHTGLVTWDRGDVVTLAAPDGVYEYRAALLDWTDSNGNTWPYGPLSATEVTE